ncbi:major facilitator superfamily domain-containing protein [Xylariales sp. PMI_506]|nr:major facilitator superfamily domain-containing protein [Xylariales sp. PMI_506]
MEANEKGAGSEHTQSHTGNTTPASREDDIRVLQFEKNDPENPYNWSQGRKIRIVLTGILTVVNSTLSSALPSNSISFIASSFGLDTSSDDSQLVLPISIYLVGYVLGPLLFGPLSESIGRRLPIFITFAGYTAFTLGTALSQDWTSLIVFRLFAGAFASAPLAIVGGIYADIYGDPVTRGRAIAVFMASIILGPSCAPMISGFISESVSWRWTFWCALILAGVSWIPLVFLPETYGPALLKSRAMRIRKAAAGTSSEAARTYAPIELEDRGWQHWLSVVLARPLRMLTTELILVAVCLYLAIIYGLFYMYFQSYPLIFKDMYGMSPGISGLMFLPIAVGTGLGLVVVLLYDGFLQRSRKAGRAWTEKEESRRLPLACLGGPFCVVALLWLGWTARTDVHWAVPCLAGVAFGMGNLLIFQSLLNYLGDAYRTFAASAMAASACTRSVFGAVLPLAATPMYTHLGIGWATTVLAALSLVMCIVPWIFMYYGDTIRAHSVFCQMLHKGDASWR